MTKEETIKVLQSIEDRAVDFPNMTACDWVAIAAAKRHLQEEPISIWHDANEKPNIKEKSGIFVITSLNGEYIGSRYYNYNDITITLGNYDKWAYLNDLLNLSNVQRTVKNRREPISDDLEKIVEEIAEPTILNAYGTKELARRLRNTIYGTSVSEDLEKAAITTADEDMQGRQIMEESNENRQLYSRIFRRGFKAGAEWQKNHLWRDAQGDDLPIFDREVIALTQPYPNDEHLRVVFAHRPSKYTKVWNYDLGEEQVVEVERYGKGGWNIPNVKYWLDCSMPKEIEL